MEESNNSNELTIGERASQFSGEFKYEQELAHVLRDLNIDKSEVCLSGSVSFAIRNIRDNNDIDVITDGNTIDSSNLPEFCDVTNNSFEMIGVSDDQILRNSKYHDIYNGFKIIRPELVFSYKKYHKRPKDKRDLELLQEYAFGNPDDWNWELVIYRGEQRFSSSASEGLPGKILTSLRKQGLRKTATEGYEQYIKDQVRNIHTIYDLFYAFYTLRKELRMKMPVDQLLARQYQFTAFEESEIFSEYLVLRALYKKEEAKQSREEFIREITESAGISIDVQDICVPLARTGRVVAPTPFAIALFLGVEEVGVNIQNSESEPELTEWANTEQLPENLSRNHARLEILRQNGMLFYAILWPAVEEYFDEIEERIAKQDHTTILSSRDIIFNGQAELAEFVWDIYDPAANPDWSTKKKIHTLHEEANKVRVLEIEFENGVSRADVQPIADSVKNEIRDEYRGHFDEYFHDIIIHMGDSYAENRYIQNVVSNFGTACFGNRDCYQKEATGTDSIGNND